MTAKALIALYWEYLQPKVKNVRPRGYEKPGERYSDRRFQAWLRVVTEPRYSEAESLLLSGTPCEWFEAELSDSLRVRPFVYREQEDKVRDLRGALVPIATAAVLAKRTVKTIHNWIGNGLRHEKRGAYYWVSVMDLEAYLPMKKRHKIAKHRKKLNDNENNRVQLAS